MKKILLLVGIATLFNCSSDDDEQESVPSYVGQYFYYRNVAKVNGTITTDNNHESNACTSKSNYNIKADKSVVSETYYSANSGGPCSSVSTANYTYDTNSQTIDGQKVKFEGNILVLSQEYTSGTQTTENIFYYRKK